MKFSLSFLLLLLYIVGFAQDAKTDSSKTLEPVLIQAYATGRPLIEVPASIGYINTTDLQRFANTSVLPAINTIPGVRMEERSPGSFRFSIRGSLLRSPFGVRNVKAYWNGLPLTDGGGNTYLNLLDFNSIGKIEVIKGPGGSLYGAGTGGVLLINSREIRSNQFEASAIAGSYGLVGWQINSQKHSEKLNLNLQYSRLASDGYRQQTAMRKDALNADITFQLNTQSALSATLFYTDLSYQTPGALTKTQYDVDPKQARPPGGPNRGAVEQQAMVSNKSPYMGLMYEHDWNDQWSTRIGLFGSYSDFTNPTIRNHEQRYEHNIGGRAETQYQFGERQKKSKVTLGGEYQYFSSPITVHWNDYGRIDTLQTKDKLTSRQMFLFAQAEMQLPANFYLTLGGSINFLQYGFTREYPGAVNEERDFDPTFSPRIALLNKITPGFSIYGSVSQGFSPPSIAELYPSRQIFDRDIDAERGNNYELGIRGEFRRALNFDITAYRFQLKKTLVIRRDPTIFGDPEYFVNAGKTSQQGIEALVSWTPLRHGKGFVSEVKIWNSYALNDYDFDEYIQDENDYSGNKITGVPPTVNTSGLDLVVIKKVHLNVTANYVDHIPLNDANTDFAGEYFLVGARVAYKTVFSKNHQLEIFGGIDNALDKKYSLGNDLNAIGGRYFNAAADRNYYVGLKYRVAE